MLWLLRFFPAYRRFEAECGSLRSSLEEVSRDKLMLQDRLDAAIEDKQQLWSMTRESLNGERLSFQMMINRSWSEHGFGPPYPEAPSPPARGPVPPPTPRREMPSEMVARKTREFLDGIANKPV